MENKGLLDQPMAETFFRRHCEYGKSSLQDFVLNEPTHDDWEYPLKLNPRTEPPLFTLKDGKCEPDHGQTELEFWVKEINRTLLTQLFLDVEESPDAQRLRKKVCLLCCLWTELWYRAHLNLSMNKRRSRGSGKRRAALSSRSNGRCSSLTVNVCIPTNR